VRQLELEEPHFESHFASEITDFNILSAQQKFSTTTGNLEDRGLTKVPIRRSRRAEPPD
jgi:hypothetical protein